MSFWQKKEIQCISHIIGADSMRPDGDKIKAITHMPDSTNVTELKQVLGLVSYVANLTSIPCIPCSGRNVSRCGVMHKRSC